MKALTRLVPMYLAGFVVATAAFVCAFVIHGWMVSRAPLKLSNLNPSDVTKVDDLPPPPFNPDAYIAENGGRSGRFQLVQLGTWRRDQFLLDTSAGRLWRPTCLGKQSKNGECGTVVWQEDKVEQPQR